MVVPVQYEKIIKKIVFFLESWKSTPNQTLFVTINSRSCELTPVMFRDTVFMMSSYPNWADTTTDWVDEHVYKYLVGRSDVTTRVRFDTTGVTLSHTCVHSVCRTGLAVDNANVAVLEVQRVVDVCEKDIPTAVVPTSMYIQKYKRFRYKGWWFGCAYVWRGNTRQEAEHNQERNVTEFQLTLELVDTMEEVDVYTAVSLLLKTNMLLCHNLEQSSFFEVCGF